MDKKKKMEIRLEIGRVLDFECGNCTKLDGIIANNKNHQKRLGICRECPTKIKLNNLVGKLEDKPVKEESTKKEKLTKEQYMLLKSAGWSDKKIREKFRMHHETLRNRKNEWCLVHV